MSARSSLALLGRWPSPRVVSASACDENILDPMADRQPRAGRYKESAFYDGRPVDARAARGHRAARAHHAERAAHDGPPARRPRAAERRAAARLRHRHPAAGDAAAPRARPQALRHHVRDLPRPARRRQQHRRDADVAASAAVAHRRRSTSRSRRATSSRSRRRASASWRPTRPSSTSQERWAVVAYLRALQLAQTRVRRPGPARQAGRARRAPPAPRERRPTIKATHEATRRSTRERGITSFAPLRPSRSSASRAVDQWLVGGGGLGLAPRARERRRASSWATPSRSALAGASYLVGVRLLVRHRDGLGHPAHDLPRDARQVDGRAAAARRGHGRDAAALPAALHPAHASRSRASTRGSTRRRRTRGTPHLGRDAARCSSTSGPGSTRASSSARGFFYILFISVVGALLFGWSKKQDASGDVQLSQKQRNLGAGALPFVGLAMTFAAFDWLMSLNPTWFSTVFGVYYFAGSFVSALSVLAIITAHARGKDSVGTLRQRRAHAQRRQAHAGLRLLLDVHRVLAAPAHLDRGPARGDAVLHHALQDGLGAAGHPPHHRKLLRAVRRAALALAQARPAQARGRRLLDPPRRTSSTSTGSSCRPSAPRACRSTGRRSRPSSAWASSRSRSACRGCAASTPCRSRIPTSPTLSGTGSH